MFRYVADPFWHSSDVRRVIARGTMAAEAEQARQEVACEMQQLERQFTQRWVARAQGTDRAV